MSNLEFSYNLFANILLGIDTDNLLEEVISMAGLPSSAERGKRLLFWP